MKNLLLVEVDFLNFQNSVTKKSYTYQHECTKIIISHFSQEKRINKEMHFIQRILTDQLQPY